MARLILSMDGLVLKEITLAKERTTIGRKPYNDIQIDNLAISGEHAAIVCILKDAFLEDLNSTNGTLVNGQPIKKHFLRHNDVIELGKYKLKFMTEAAAAMVAVGDEKQALALTPDELALQPRSGEVPARPAPAEAAPAPMAPKPAVAQPVPVSAAIKLLNGGNAGRTLDLTKEQTTLGKPGVQVAIIARRPQGYFITHVEGAQFPLVNGKAIAAQAHPLNDRDVVELAGIRMEFIRKP